MVFMECYQKKKKKKKKKEMGHGELKINPPTPCQ